MSIKSTRTVTREFAIAAILKKLYECTDDQLGNVLEEVIHNGFYNFVIGEPEPGDVHMDINDLPEYNNAY